MLPAATRFGQALSAPHGLNGGRSGFSGSKDQPQKILPPVNWPMKNSMEFLNFWKVGFKFQVRMYMNIQDISRHFKTSTLVSWMPSTNKHHLFLHLRNPKMPHRSWHLRCHTLGQQITRSHMMKPLDSQIAQSLCGQVADHVGYTPNWRVQLMKQPAQETEVTWINKLQNRLGNSDFKGQKISLIAVPGVVWAFLTTQQWFPPSWCGAASTVTNLCFSMFEKTTQCTCTQSCNGTSQLSVLCLEYS